MNFSSTFISLIHGARIDLLRSVLRRQNPVLTVSIVKIFPNLLNFIRRDRGGLQ